MTKQELISRQKAMTRRILVVLIVFFGLLLANVPLGIFMDIKKPATWIQVLYGAAFFGFLIGSVLLSIWLQKRELRRFGLHCPSCGKPLIGIIGQIAVATGACGHCGERVLSDEEVEIGNK
jgi:hypothetical protein